MKIYKKCDYIILRREVVRVRIIGQELEITYTDGQGHSWFERYTEEQLTEYFREAMK